MFNRFIPIFNTLFTYVLTSGIIVYAIVFKQLKNIVRQNFELNRSTGVSFVLLFLLLIMLLAFHTIEFKKVIATIKGKNRK